jgi:hypothetical protein
MQKLPLINRLLNNVLTIPVPKLEKPSKEKPRILWDVKKKGPYVKERHGNLV